MKRTTYRKTDVQTHRVGYGYNSAPAVNIKLDLYNWLRRVDRAEVAYYVGDDEVAEFMAWLDDRYDDDNDPDGTDLWGLAESHAEGEWEYFADWAVEHFGRGVRISREGRSGGWMTVEGLDDIERWDAIALGKWRQWERWVRSTIEDFPTGMAVLAAINEWEVVRAEREAKRAEAAYNDAETVAAALPILAGV